MATTTVAVPYGVYLVTNEIMEMEKTANFDTERCVYPKIAMHSDTKFVVGNALDTKFDTKLRIYNPDLSSAKRVCLVFD